MGGSTRRYSSVHDTIGFFAKGRDYHFDLDAVRVPYDEQTKKARSRSIFVGAKWLELGYNPKDVWSVSRLHREHREPVYNTVARHLSGVAPCGTGLIISGLAMADMLVEFDVDVVIPA